jgi:predicted Abi (CAAX) family protease
MGKIRGWQVVLLWAIGIYWGSFCHDRIDNLSGSIRSAHATAIVEEVRAKDRAIDYLPNGNWMGRLILPSQVEISDANLGDWVWIEIAHTPKKQAQFVGKTLRLSWSPQSSIASDVRQITTDIHFTPETIASQAKGNIHPARLNGRSQVGSLQSLAGARPIDDVWVKLDGVDRIDLESRTMTIDREPIQITGKLRGLVEIVGAGKSLKSVTTACDEARSCPNEYFQVRHYHGNVRRFDGQIETIRIPQVAATKSGLLPSTIRDLDRSPAGSQGWYIYGDRDRAGIFTVAAIQPRALSTLTPQREIVDRDAKLDYFNWQHWQDPAADRGKISKVVFNPRTLKLGAKALLIHSFGGIGGKYGDIPGVWKTVTGHFAYGIATVIRDEFTHELQWSIEYNQVYAHNPNGIIAGKQDWATYMGNLQRGWLATRPVADLAIDYPPVTEDYNFDGTILSPLTELARQLHLFAARYRTGDGTGNASVTPATSCVQDANQALYITIQQLTDRARLPQIQAWLATHPQHPQTLRFRQLQALGAELQTTLTPLGIVRQDWHQNAAKLAGIGGEQEFMSSSNPLAGLTSWRTMLPRGAQDGIGKIFSSYGAGIWFLNTYQVGGWNPDLVPIAPTILFGEIPLLSIIVVRLWAGISTLPNIWGWLSGVGLLIGYGIIAIGFGFKSGFLKLDNRWQGVTWEIGQLLLMPALVEEILFRLLLIPHPIETATSTDTWLWSIISLILFIAYHPLNATYCYPQGKPTFMDWRFLSLTALLGITCTVAYLITESIWLSVIIHWVVVSLWLKLFGGEERLQLTNRYLLLSANNADDENI